MTLHFKGLINDARRKCLLKIVNGCLEGFYIATFTNDQLNLLPSPKVGTMRAYAQETKRTDHSSPTRTTQRRWDDLNTKTGEYEMNASAMHMNTRRNRSLVLATAIGVAIGLATSTHPAFAASSASASISFSPRSLQFDERLIRTCPGSTRSAPKEVTMTVITSGSGYTTLPWRFTWTGNRTDFGVRRTVSREANIELPFKASKVTKRTLKFTFWPRTQGPKAATVQVELLGRRDFLIDTLKRMKKYNVGSGDRRESLSNILTNPEFSSTPKRIDGASKSVAVTLSGTGLPCPPPRRVASNTNFRQDLQESYAGFASGGEPQSAFASTALGDSLVGDGLPVVVAGHQDALAMTRNITDIDTADPNRVVDGQDGAPGMLLDFGGEFREIEGDGSGGADAGNDDLSTATIIGPDNASIIGFVTDLDDDSVPDEVRLNEVYGQVFVYRGTYEGGLERIGEFEVGVEPAALIVADVSNDGIKDIVVNNADSTTLSIFEGLGDGSFGPEMITYLY